MSSVCENITLLSYQKLEKLSFEGEVSVAWSPSDFYITNTEKEVLKTYFDLMSHIQAAYRPPLHEKYILTRDQIYCGRLVLVFFDGLWVRGCVLGYKGDDTWEVFLVDNGDRVPVELNLILALKTSFAQLPMQSVPGKLAFLHPKEEAWPKSVTEAFSDMFLDRGVLVRVISLKPDPKDGRYEVCLLDKETKRSLDVTLYRSGFALFPGEKLKKERDVKDLSEMMEQRKLLRVRRRQLHKHPLMDDDVKSIIKEEEFVKDAISKERESESVEIEIPPVSLPTKSEPLEIPNGTNDLVTANISPVGVDEKQDIKPTVSESPVSALVASSPSGVTVDVPLSYAKSRDDLSPRFQNVYPNERQVQMPLVELHGNTAQQMVGPPSSFANTAQQMVGPPSSFANTAQQMVGQPPSFGNTAQQMVGPHPPFVFNYGPSPPQLQQFAQPIHPPPPQFMQLSQFSQFAPRSSTHFVPVQAPMNFYSGPSFINRPPGFPSVPGPFLMSGTPPTASCAYSTNPPSVTPSLPGTPPTNSYTNAPSVTTSNFPEDAASLAKSLTKEKIKSLVEDILAEQQSQQAYGATFVKENHDFWKK